MKSRREHGGEELPEFLGGGDAGTFFFGVGLVDVGAKRDHVETGVGFGDDAALESGMAGANFDLMIEEVAIEGAHYFEDWRGSTGAPTGVTGIVLNLGADQVEGGCEGVGDILFAGVDGTALETAAVEASVGDVDEREIGRGFDEARDDGAHAINAVGD